MSEQRDVEVLLTSALKPVEVPVTLPGRVELRLEEMGLRIEEGLSRIADTAAKELADADPHNPRHWLRYAAWGAAGVSAGAGLLVLRQMQRQRRKPSGVRGLANQARARFRG